MATDTPEQITEEINRSIPEIDITMGLGSSEGLKALMQKSDLIDSDPERTRRFLELAPNCHWVGTATEFTYLTSSRSEAQKPVEPYILGISNWLDATDSYAQMTDGTSWIDAYKALGISPTEPNHTDKFMTRITDSRQAIVFFIPPHLYSSTNTGARWTQDEMEWIMNHPDKATNIYLVFGGYNFVDEQWHKDNWKNYSESERLHHKARAFQKWIDNLFLVKTQSKKD